MRLSASAILAAAVATLVAMPAHADNHGKGRPIIDVDVTAKGGKKSALLDLDATLNKGRGPLLDVDATIGKTKKGSLLDLDLDVSKQKGVDLDLTLGGKRGNSRGGYDFGGGVGY